MSLIQEFMPRWRLRQVDRIAVAAEPEPAFRAVRSLDLFKVPVARSLFALRTWQRQQTAEGIHRCRAKLARREIRAAGLQVDKGGRIDRCRRRTRR